MPAKLKMSKPEYIYIDADKMSVHKDDDKRVKVIAGKFEKAEGPVKKHNVEPVYFDVELDKNNWNTWPPVSISHPNEKELIWFSFFIGWIILSPLFIIGIHS